MHGIRMPADVRYDEGFLFPSALQAPGPRHIFDLSIRHSLETVEWWAPLRQAMKDSGSS